MSLTAPSLSSGWFARPLILGGAVLLTLFAAIGFLGLQYWHERQAASLSVEHGRQVLDRLDLLRVNLADLEAQRRGYLLTLDPTYIKAYGVSDEQVRLQAEALQTLVAADPLQSLRAAHLALTVSAMLREMDDIVKKARTSGSDATLATVRSMDQIRSQIDQMVDHQHFLLVNWETRAGVLEQRRTWLIAAAVVAITVLAGAALALARLEAGRRRKATEENVQLHGDLAERERKIRRLFDSNIIGIVIFDFEGRFIDANNAFLDMVGYSREDLVSGRMRWTDMTPTEWRAASKQQVADMRATATPPAFEKEYFRKDGSRVPVLVGAVALEESREEGVAFVLDLTERKRAEEALRQSQMELAHVTRMTTLGELAASIAHEVNQPLAAIITNGEVSLRLLDREAPALAEVREALGDVISDGRRASEIIQRLRALSGKTETQKVALDINGAISEVIPLVQHEVLRYRVSLRRELVPALPAVLGDRVQLQQVIINLVVNGMEAMASVTDRRRELVVRSQLDGSGQVLVAVQDSGVGIDPENANKLFNAFFTTKPSGMGMGLSICRSIIEDHGGMLWATRNAGPGATFQFTLRSHQEVRS